MEVAIKKGVSGQGVEFIDGEAGDVVRDRCSLSSSDVRDPKIQVDRRSLMARNALLNRSLQFLQLQLETFPLWDRKQMFSDMSREIWHSLGLIRTCPFPRASLKKRAKRSDYGALL